MKDFLRFFRLHASWLSSLGFPKFPTRSRTPFAFRRVLETARVRFLFALQNRVRCRAASLFARAPARSASNRQDGQVHEPHGAQPVVQEPPQRCVSPPPRRTARRGSRRSARFHAIARHSRRGTFQPRAPGDRAVSAPLAPRTTPDLMRGLLERHGALDRFSSPRRVARVAGPAGRVVARIGFSRS